MSNGIEKYFTVDAGLNVQPNQKSPDNENGIVYYALYKYLMGAKEIPSIHGGLPYSLMSKRTGMFSRYNPVKYKTFVHDNDISIDNLVGIIYTDKSAATAIWRTLLENKFRYDDVQPRSMRWSRFMGYRLDIMYYIAYNAGSKIAPLLLIPYMIMRGMSSLRGVVVRPTIYQYLIAKYREWRGTLLEKDIPDTIWKRSPNIPDTSGKVLTLLMNDTCYVPGFFKIFVHGKINKLFKDLHGLVVLYLTKHGRVDLFPLIEMSAGKSI